MLFESALECPQIIKPNHKFYGNRNADTLVIFVPGLCGSSEQTWTNQPSGFNFPSELAQDLDDVYVMSFGFASQLERGPSLLSITDHLTFEMDELFRERNYVNIIFIAHSMGGIIAREYVLRRQPNVHPQIDVSKIITLATPNNGAELARLAWLIPRNRQIQELRHVDQGNTFLESLNSDWNRAFKAQGHPRNIKLYAGYEQLPMSISGELVSLSSAITFADQPMGFQKTHIEIAKPTDWSDSLYRWVKASVQEIPTTHQPDLVLEFGSPKALIFKVKNQTEIVADNLHYGFGIWDLDEGFPNALPIPYQREAFLRGKSELGPSQLLTQLGKVGHRYFGFARVTCRNCQRERYYWLYFVHGMETGAWYTEVQTAQWDDEAFIKDPYEYIRVHFPDEKRVRIDSGGTKLSTTFPSRTPPLETIGPIENLARLGWDIKRDAEGGNVFEIAGKPLPNMEKSASYFRVLNKPFGLRVRQVSSIAGFKFLSGTTNCIRLEISASDIDNISELGDLTGLRTLAISQTPFTARHELNVSPIASLTNLETVTLNGSRVSYIEPLGGLRKLASLNLGQSLVRDLSPIKGLSLLRSLDVRGSRVTDLSVLDGAEVLEELSVDEKQVPSLRQLSHLPNLSKLTVISHVPFNMAPVGTLSNLKALFVWGPPVIDLAPLRKSAKLTHLTIMGFGFLSGRSMVLDADAIEELPQLRALTLGQVQIDSIRFLAKSNSLVELNLSGLPLRTISELANLMSLQKISLTDIPVVDISPLLSLPNLTSLYVLRTPARADVISELERRGVKVVMN